MIDEVEIKGKQTYLKNSDKTIGGVDMAGEVEVKDPNALAKKLLVFAINGLSASFTIRVGMFLVSSLTVEELLKMTKNVIEEVEKLGFRVHQLVTDNLVVNPKMYKLLCEEDLPGSGLRYEIRHPFNPELPLFLIFDSSHIIKNIQNQFIDRVFSI